MWCCSTRLSRRISSWRSARESGAVLPRSRAGADCRARPRCDRVPTIVVVDPPLLLRALEVYEVDRIDFAEAYLVASAEASGVETIASFDRAIDRVTTVRRVESF